MYYMHLNAIFATDVFAEMLCRIYTAVLTACTSETKHQTCEASLDVSAYMCIGKLVNIVEEREYFAIIFKESDYGFVKSGKLLVRVVTTRIMGGAAIKNVSSAVSALIFRYSLSVREAVHRNNQRALAVIFGECGRTVLGMCLVDVSLGSTVTVGTRQCRLFYARKARQLREPSQHIHHVRIRETVELQQFAQVLYRIRNGIDKMLLLLEIASETIRPKNLKRSEQHELAQAINKMT